MLPAHQRIERTKSQTGSGARGNTERSRSKSANHEDKNYKSQRSRANIKGVTQVRPYGDTKEANINDADAHSK